MSPEADQSEQVDQSDELEAFWEVARREARLSEMPGYFGPSVLSSLRPNAWAFGDSPELADELLGLVLAGTKTATSGALWDYETEGEPLPEPGVLHILLDGAGHPRALIVTTEVAVVPFAEVDEAFAVAEGEGGLEAWRAEHRRFFTEVATHEHGFSEDIPVVAQRFELVWAPDR